MSSRLSCWFWLLSILVVVAGSLSPAGSPMMRAVAWLPVGAKTLHFCAYAWLALLALLAVRHRSLAALAAFATILLGVALEFGQRWVPGRGFEIRDMFINGAGVLSGVAIVVLSRTIMAAIKA